MGWLGDVLTDVVGKVIGGVGNAATGVIDYFFGWLFDLINGLLRLVFKLVSTLLIDGGDSLSGCKDTVRWGPTPTCIGENVVHAYGVTWGQSLLLMSLVIVIGATIAVVNTITGQKAEGQVGLGKLVMTIPKVFALQVSLLAITAILIAIGDQFAFAFANAVTPLDIEGSGDLLGAVLTPLEIDGATFIPGPGQAKAVLAAVIAVVGLISVIIMGLTLIVRAASIQIALVLSPLVALTLFTRYGVSMRKMLEKVVGLILMKPIMIMVLALGVSILSGYGDESADIWSFDTITDVVDESDGAGEFSAALLNEVSNSLVGMMTVVIAAIAPMMVFAFIPELESAGSASGAPGRGAQKALQFGYYGKMFRGGRGGIGKAARAGVG